VRRAAASVFAVALVASCSACGGGEAPAPAQDKAQGSVEAPAAKQEDTPAPPTPPPANAAPLSKSSVTIYFPSAAGDTLTAETREIVDTKAPADRGAQVLAELISGPTTDAGLPAVPPGTTLRRLWVRDDGSAYADFSEELATGTGGGSADEILTVYAIVDSLTANVPAIKRVGILVAGHERETLGHLDLRRPLPPDLTLAPQAKPTE
jgi:spore germination protein GerM